MSNIVCYDAGFVNLGWVVASVDKRSEPSIIDCGLSVAPQLPEKERKRRGLSAAHNNIARIERQADHMLMLDKKFTPVAYFSEVPHGGAKGALAIRAMAYATATLATVLRVVAKDRPVVYLLPSDVKELIGGKTTASKETLASAVRNFWPSIDWNKWGALSENVTDAAAVCLSMRFHSVYKALMAS